MLPSGCVPGALSLLDEILNLNSPLQRNPRNLSRPDSQPPLRVRQKTSYAIGDIADGIQGAVVNTFLLFYLTSVCGLAGSLAGLALAITLVLEAITTPLFGYLSDNTKSKWGRRHPYMFLAAPTLALSIGLIFSVPAMESTWATFSYVLFVLIILRTSFSAFALPYAALGAELSKDYSERSVIMAYRNFFNIGGTLLCYVLGFGVFLSRNENDLVSRESYVMFGWVCAAFLLLSAFTAAWSSSGLRLRLQQVEQVSKSTLSHFSSELRNVFRNPSFIVLFLMVLTFSISQGTIESLSVHALKFFWDIPTSVTSNIFVLRTIGMACGIPLYSVLLRRLEKRDILILTILLMSALQFSLPLMGILGMVPRQGFELHLILYGAFIINGSLVTFLFISFGSMAADAADEHDLRFGVRREGLYFAGLIFSGKCALGIGTLIAGICLDLIGFPQDIASDPNQTISPVTIQNLALVYGPGAALVGALGAVIMLPYKLDRQEHARIQRELSKRNAAA
jgi:GPH family glycoside/pentoside/hexuronide:cation symporter